MNKLEKTLFVLACFAEAVILNASQVTTLEGLNLLVWIIFNVWIWCFAPIFIVIVNRHEEKEQKV